MIPQLYKLAKEDAKSVHVPQQKTSANKHFKDIPSLLQTKLFLVHQDVHNVNQPTQPFAPPALNRLFCSVIDVLSVRLHAQVAVLQVLHFAQNA